MRKTKIVATMGPASQDPQIIEELIEAGVNICRLNFSHLRAQDAESLVASIRSASTKLGQAVAILADLQGPKLRLGEMAPKTVLEEGATFWLQSGDGQGSAAGAFISYVGFARDVKHGDRVLLDDGKLELEVLQVDTSGQVTTRIRCGGPLGSRKGVNLPNTHLSIPSLTEKDRDDLQTALALEVEWIGLSFVRSSADVTELKSLIAAAGSSARVIAKIEKPEAVTHIDEILSVTDGVMVARGDLGVEIPMEEVPLVQKQIVKKAREHARPAIIATQMMESMIDARRPTRAEASDVSNSVLDGADALMLSGETSVGQHPVLVVNAMRQIIERTEADGHREGPLLTPDPADDRFLSSVICYTACRMANRLQAKGVVAVTHSGFAAFKLASYRPHGSIFVFTNNASLVSTLGLLWGVRAFFFDRFDSSDDTVHDVLSILREAGEVVSGDLIVNTGSNVNIMNGHTCLLQVRHVP